MSDGAAATIKWHQLSGKSRAVVAVVAAVDTGRSSKKGCAIRTQEQGVEVWWRDVRFNAADPMSPWLGRHVAETAQGNHSPVGAVQAPSGSSASGCVCAKGRQMGSWTFAICAGCRFRSIIVQAFYKHISHFHMITCR
jgi:hypothetical protein